MIHTDEQRRVVSVIRTFVEAAIRYAQVRRTFGRPIAEHQAIQLKLADVATNVEAARLLTLEAARLKDAGERADLPAGMAKLFASETVHEVALEAMRIHGGYGYTTEFPVERYYRDAPPPDHRRGHQRDPAARDRPSAPPPLRNPRRG